MVSVSKDQGVNSATSLSRGCCAWQGDPADTIPKLVKDAGAGLLVVDQSPVRLAQSWRKQACMQRCIQGSERGAQLPTLWLAVHMTA